MPITKKLKMKGINVDSIEDMINEVLKKEGGFVNHPADKGGPTNRGITLNTLSKWLGYPAHLEDIRNITVDTAKEIYRKNYFYNPGINELPIEIQPLIFDSAINHGPSRAIKFVQLVINKAGFGHVSIDGIMGPKTKMKSFQALDEMNDYFINALVDERILFYKKIVLNDSSQSVFFKGWISRAESFRVKVKGEI